MRIGAGVQKTIDTFQYMRGNVGVDRLLCKPVCFFMQGKFIRIGEDFLMAFIIRPAREEDTAAIFGMICELADYEKMSSDVVATEAMLRSEIFEKKSVEVLIGELDGTAVAFALYFYNFSTFLGRRGLYLEDVFVRQPYRGRGFGRQMLHRLAERAVEQGCGRVEWSCLDWNEPSIKFYRSLGAEAMDQWTVYRLTGDKLINFAKEEPKCQ